MSFRFERVAEPGPGTIDSEEEGGSVFHERLFIEYEGLSWAFVGRAGRGYLFENPDDGLLTLSLKEVVDLVREDWPATTAPSA